MGCLSHPTVHMKRHTITDRQASLAPVAESLERQTSLIHPFLAQLSIVKGDLIDVYLIDSLFQHTQCMLLWQVNQIANLIKWSQGTTVCPSKH